MPNHINIVYRVAVGFIGSDSTTKFCNVYPMSTFPASYVRCMTVECQLIFFALVTASQMLLFLL